MTATDWASVHWPIWSLSIFSFAGTLILYAKLNRRKAQQKMYGLTPVLERLVPNERIRYTLEPIVFAIVGTGVAMALGQPVNRAQAVAAGLGWTAALSSG